MDLIDICLFCVTSCLDLNKVKFPLKISDQAWWLKVQVLKHRGKSSRNKRDNGPKDMEVDHVVVVHSDLSSKACQPKDVSTKDDLPVESGTSVQTSNPTKLFLAFPMFQQRTMLDISRT